MRRNISPLALKTLPAARDAAAARLPSVAGTPPADVGILTYHHRAAPKGAASSCHITCLSLAEKFWNFSKQNKHCNVALFDRSAELKFFRF
jgi:hypothetical protein